MITGLKWSKILKAEKAGDKLALVNEYERKLALLGHEVNKNNIDTYNDTKYRYLTGSRISISGYELLYDDCTRCCIPPNMTTLCLNSIKKTDKNILSCVITGLNRMDIPAFSSIKLEPKGSADNIDAVIHCEKLLKLEGEAHYIHLKSEYKDLTIVDLASIHLRSINFDDNIALISNNIPIKLGKVKEYISREENVSVFFDAINRAFKEYAKADDETVLKFSGSDTGLIFDEKLTINTTGKLIIVGIKEIKELLSHELVRNVINLEVSKEIEKGVLR